jgi:asparagine synthase (glutamine-hydrolysing)
VYAELLAAGRLIDLWRELRRARAEGATRRHLAGLTFGPWMPRPVWIALKRLLGKPGTGLRDVTALAPDVIERPTFRRAVRRARYGTSFQPWADGIGMRLSGLHAGDMGGYLKGVLAGWGIDERDPCADIRLVQFCLSLPTELYRRDGVPRALARSAFTDRLPPEIYQERRKGVPLADWHQVIVAFQDELREAVETLSNMKELAGIIDTKRLKAELLLLPEDGWNDRGPIENRYRTALTGCIAAGYFVRKAIGSNSY